MYANHVNPTYLVGMMLLNHEPWISIIRDRKTPACLLKKYKQIKMVYSQRTLSYSVRKIRKFIQSLRWATNKNTPNGISFIPVAVYKLWRNAVSNGSKSDVGKACHFRLKSGNLSSRNDVILAKRFLQRLDYI